MLYITLYLKVPQRFLNVAHLTLHVGDLPGEAGLQGVGHGGVEGGGHLFLPALLVLPLGEHAGLVHLLVVCIYLSHIYEPTLRRWDEAHPQGVISRLLWRRKYI